MPGQYSLADVQEPPKMGQFSMSDVAPPEAPPPSAYQRLTSAVDPGTEEFASKHPVLGVPARFLSSAGSAAMGLPGNIYKAFTDPLTPEEEKNFQGHTRIPGEVILERLTGAEGAPQALADWASGKVSPRAAASVLPELAGQATGASAAAGLAGEALGAVPKAAQAIGDISPTKITAPVRAAARGANTVLAKAPGSIGAAGGAAIGRATGIPGMAEVGGAAGYALGKELLPQVKLPGENFGFPSRVEGGPATVPEEVPAAAQEAPAAEAEAPRGQNLEAPLHRLQADSALRRVLTGQDNANLLKIAKSRGINVTKEAQLKPGVADNQLINKIIDDYAPEELDDIADKYEQAQRNMHNFGDIGPEAWKTLSLQTYFPELKVSNAALLRTQKAIKAGELPNDLTDLLQRSLEAVKAK